MFWWMVVRLYRLCDASLLWLKSSIYEEVNTSRILAKRLEWLEVCSVGRILWSRRKISYNFVWGIWKKHESRQWRLCYLEIMLPWMQATKVVYLGGVVVMTDSFLDLLASYLLDLVKIHYQTGSVIHSFVAGKGGYFVHFQMLIELKFVRQVFSLSLKWCNDTRTEDSTLCTYLPVRLSVDLSLHVHTWFVLLVYRLRALNTLWLSTPSDLG